MSTLSIETSPKSKRTARKTGGGGADAESRRKAKPAAAIASTPPTHHERQSERVTKQERVLTLLSRPAGASIEEMMQATDWQQHSVRGFLAGTVKKKLGFTLLSSKATGDVRRYRVETRRGR